MLVGLRLYRHGDMRYPHIFLVHRVGHPQVAISRHTIAFLNTSYILWSVRLVVAAITHRGYFALYEVQRGIFVTIFRERDAQWPAVFGGVIDGSIRVIAQTLSPDFRIAIDKTLGTLHRLSPRQTSVSRGRGQRMFPQRGNLSVGQGIVAIGFVLFMQGYQRVVAVCLLHPLHAVAGVSQNLLAGLFDVPGSFGVERERFTSLTSLTSITSVVVDEIDRA